MKRASIGVPLPGTDVRIVDDDGRDVPDGEAGELIVKGPQVMAGYWQRPDETARTIRDGWLYTGDVAQMDDEGYIFIVDRKKDMILVSGFNVYPNEVEAVIATHPGVQDCAVVGVPDEDTGEWVVAYVIRKDRGVTVEMIRDHCRESLTAYKVPKLVDLPRRTAEVAGRQGAAKGPAGGGAGGEAVIGSGLARLPTPVLPDP